MAKRTKILIAVVLTTLFSIVLAIYPGVIRPALSREKSTVEIIVIDNLGHAVPSAEMTIGEYGFRYLFPMPFVSPAWFSPKQLKTYTSDQNGLCHITFYDEKIELVKMCVTGNCIPSKSEAPRMDTPQNAYYTYEYIRWWTNSQDPTPLAKPHIDSQSSPLLVDRGYIDRHILGHKVRIIITKQ